jgi:hypothetical protein
MLELEEDENTSMNEVDKASKEKLFKPPPIFVQGVKNVFPLTDLLNAKAKVIIKLKYSTLTKIKFNL